MSVLRGIIRFVIGDAEAERAVPPSGFTVRLTVMSAAAMALLMVFALALSLASGRLAQRWDSELSRTASLRISAPQAQMAAQTEAALAVLTTTEGIESARALEAEEQAALLKHWFGEDLPLDSLPMPQIIEISTSAQGFDADGLRQRLRGEVPGAVLDDHARWRAPLVKSARALRRLSWLAIVLMTGATGAMITLAANAALSANAQVISVLRLIGARDSYIAQAFVRRFTLRALSGAAGGMAAGMLALWLLPRASEEGGFLTGIGLSGWHWLVPLLIPPLIAAVAFVATRIAAGRTLKELP